MPPPSFVGVLDRRLRHDPGQPFVTFYDDATGERTELSMTTYANWVAKTAGVLTEDLDLVDGDRVVLDLPTHWLGPVFLGAAWLVGLDVRRPSAEPVDLVVTGPGGSDQPADQRLACALLPFAVASRDPLPDGVLDFGSLWTSQPDVFLGAPAGPSALLDRPGSSDRVLTDLAPQSPEGVEVLLDALVGGGSVVWVAHPAPDRWPDRAAAERTTRRVVSRRAPRRPPQPPGSGG